MVKYIKLKIVAVKDIFLQLKFIVRILLLFIIIVLPLMTGAIIATGKPGFCNSCHVMNPYYDNWKLSAHKEVNCLSCHLQPGLLGYMKGKITGLAQAVDCVVGRVGTKPNAKVEDASCLRSECHSSEELESDDIVFNEIKFSHKGHIFETIAGIEVSCGTCHNHFEGDEHFNTSKEVCFTCHFLNDEDTEGQVVESACQDCHEVPDKIIERGFVSVNHLEFVSYEANCDDSCHIRQTKKISHVESKICLSCHSHTKDYEEISTTELHKVHTTGEKVECFACHGTVVHGPTETSSIATMIDCKNCHSDTHNVQQSIFGAEKDPKGHESGRILSPMFLTHVQCTDCHIEQTQSKSGTLDSFGKVAKAVPRACDKCHEPGTGEQYIPFWQKQIKKRHKQVTKRMYIIQDRASSAKDMAYAEELKDKISRAKEILDSIEADGSWGVHNLKYTEAMLSKANEILTEEY